MEKRVLEILLELQTDMREVKTELKEVKMEMNEVKMEMNEVKMEMNEVKTDVREIKGTVNRIETSQSEEVMRMLKVTKKNTAFEVDYLNNRLTEMDKRLFNIEKRIEN